MSTISRIKSTSKNKNRAISLSKVSGLPIRFANDTLVFDNSISLKSTSYRTLKDARPYLKNKDAVSNLSKIYAMHRGICKKTDPAKFEKYGLRYDITVIYPGTIGSEFTKTVGHYHEEKPKTGLSFPEIYEVLSGRGVFLFQKHAPYRDTGDRNDAVSEIYAILAKPKDKIIVPPGFGHVSVNLDEIPFIIANIFSGTAKSIYWDMKKHKGEGYYLTQIKPDSVQIHADKKIKVSVIANPRYKRVAPLKWATPKTAFKISARTPLYESFVKNPKKFDFLNNPENHKKELDPKNLFKILTK